MTNTKIHLPQITFPPSLTTGHICCIQCCHLVIQQKNIYIYIFWLINTVIVTTLYLRRLLHNTAPHSGHFDKNFLKN